MTKLPLQVDDRDGEATSSLPSKSGPPLSRLRRQPDLRPEGSTLSFERVPFPKPATRSLGFRLSFALVVILPTIVVAGYEIFWASNQYETEFRFYVQQASLSASPTASSSSDISSALAPLLGGVSVSSSQNYMVTDYLQSAQAVREIQKMVDLRAIYSNKLADYFSRFNPSDSAEQLAKYWKRVISANYDETTGLATVSVRAFTPDQAKQVADALVKISEDLVNRIANRPNQDAVRFAQDEAVKAEATLKVASGKISDFRNENNLIDPSASVVASNVAIANSLRTNISGIDAQITALKQAKISPDSPQYQNLLNQISAARDQLKKVENVVPHGADLDSSISKVVGEYEKLDLDKQFAARTLSGAIAAVDQARVNAAAQHMYITPYVLPQAPETSTYPNRFAVIAWTAGAAFVLWMLGALVALSIREHMD